MGGKLAGKLEIREIRIWVSRRIFVRVKKKFSGEDKELVKVAELKRVEQERRIMEEFV